jgi:caffeoyl-CoA O-methyltransferase
MADVISDETRARLDAYVSELFVHEDEALKWITEEAVRQQLPAISVRPFEGKLLRMLVWMSGAKKVVEIGTLAGYSGVWLARALPPGGKLYTLEKSSKHATIARASFERAGVSECVELLEGDGLELLAKLSPQAPFDLIFIDADKARYADYMAWSATHVRAGGIVAAHNAFRVGKVLEPQSDDDRLIDAFNHALAKDTRFESLILAIGDGLAVGVRK